MVLPKKIALTLVLIGLMISCGDAHKDQQKSDPQKNVIPSSELKKNTPTTTKPRIVEPSKARSEEETEKKKQRKRDTLKPITILP